MSHKQPPRPLGTPPQEGNAYPKDGAQNSPPLEGWQAQPDGVVPRLRFPEFRDKGEWDADELGEIAEFVNEKIPLERIALENYVSTENILQDYGGVARASKLPAMGSVTRFRSNDTLVSNIRPYLKKVWVADKEGGASNDVIVIRAKPRLLPQYFSFLLKNDAFIDYVMMGAKGVKMPRGDIGSMKEYPALYPSKAEQQKIADCLTSIDELITAQTQKIDALKAHKKGLMQGLFPSNGGVGSEAGRGGDYAEGDHPTPAGHPSSGGEFVPKLRFPEFRDKGEWKEIRLKNVCERIMDGTHFSPKSKEGPRMYLTSKNIQDGAITLSNISYISEEEHRQIYARCPVIRNDVLLTKDGANTGNCALNELEFEFSLLSSVAVLRGNPLLVAQGFLYQIIQSDKVQKLIKESMSGQAITRITLEKIGNFEISITGTKEQQKIVDCLTAVDELLAAQTQKLDALKTHKKGLMQQLFPCLSKE